MIIIVMGVSGAGKTTVGNLLATGVNWPFFEGDDFHPQANVEKMSEGSPLTDEERRPWLKSLRKLISGIINDGQDAVIACSALKQTYREVLRRGDEEVVFAYLKGEYDLVAQRLGERQGHFMGAELLQSQFDTLEEPQTALTLSIDQSPSEIVRAVRESLNL